MAKKNRKTLTKEEAQVAETIRMLTHVPLNSIQEVLKGLGTSIALQYADILDKKEKGEKPENDIILPYIGKLKVNEDHLLLEWDKNSFTLNEMVDVKRSVDEGDFQLIDSWYNRLEANLREKV